MRKRALRFGIAMPLAMMSVAAVAADCVVYEDRDFRGARLAIGNGEVVKMVDPPEIATTTNGHGPVSNIRYEPDWNDVISSYKVRPGCTLYMWEHVDEDGWMLTRTQPAMPYIGDRRNDEVSEAKCVC